MWKMILQNFKHPQTISKHGKRMYIIHLFTWMIVGIKRFSKSLRKGGVNWMTVNQLTYARLKEDQRANLAREAETNRANLAGERETNRHNVTTEGLAKEAQDETKRANLAREVETNRANLAKEAEAQRSNIAREVETHRSNTAQEAETARSNLAKETETNRANVAREVETNRSNVQQERLGQKNLAARYREISNDFIKWQRGELPKSQSQSLLNQANALLAKAKALQTNTETSFAWLDRLESIIDALIPG